MVEVAKWFYWLSVFSIALVGLSFLLAITGMIAEACKFVLEKYVDNRIEAYIKETELYVCSGCKREDKK